MLAHASTIRLSLRKGKAEQRLMKVIDAPNLRKFLLPTTYVCHKELCMSTHRNVSLCLQTVLLACKRLVCQHSDLMAA